MTTKDYRFDAYVTSDGHAVDFPIARRAKDIDALYSQWQLDVAAAQSRAGRPLSKDELRAGIK